MGYKKTCCKRYKRKGKACKDCPLKGSHPSFIVTALQKALRNH